jgi:hypothetical protein
VSTLLSTRADKDIDVFKYAMSASVEGTVSTLLSTRADKDTDVFKYAMSGRVLPVWIPGSR